MNQSASYLIITAVVILFIMYLPEIRYYWAKITGKVKEESEEATYGGKFGVPDVADVPPEMIQFNIQNNTDQEQLVYLFNHKKNAEGVTVYNDNIEILGKYLQNNKKMVLAVRALFDNPMQMFKTMYAEFTDPISRQEQTCPIMVFADELDVNQFQTNIVDASPNNIVVLDGVKTDIKVFVQAKCSLNVIFFVKDYDPQDRFTAENNILTGLVITNNSDEEREVELFDADKYEKEYSKLAGFSIENIFGGMLSYKEVCAYFSLPVENPSEEQIEKARKKGAYDFIRIYSTNKEQLKKRIELKLSSSISSTIAIASAILPTQFQTNAVDMNLGSPNDINKLNGSPYPQHFLCGKYCPKIMIAPKSVTAVIFKKLS